MTVRNREAEPDGYDATDDLEQSLLEAYRVIRERMERGGPRWRPKILGPQVCAVNPAGEVPPG
jgi:hypothetical protein